MLFPSSELALVRLGNAEAVFPVVSGVDMLLDGNETWRDANFRGP